MTPPPCPHCHVAHTGECDGIAAQLARYRATLAAGLVWKRPPQWWEWKKGKPPFGDNDA